MENKLLGHEFLASLGKKRLRPGGLSGTNYLIEYIKNKYKDTGKLKILEISCNRGYSLIYLSKHLDSSFYGIDINKEAINIAKKNISKHKLDDRVKVFEMNALDMNFDNMKFDIIINEALLTMCKDKKMFLKSYKKHLKSNGLLLTHDICIVNNENKDFSNELKSVINLKPYPLNESNWTQTFIDSGFKVLDNRLFNFSLVSFKGLIKDEGLFNMLKILLRSRQKQNRKDFDNMRKYFRSNKNNLKAICYVCTLNKE